MKKLLLLVPVLLIIGCGLFGGKDFYPLKIGNIWKYTGYTTMADTAATTVDTMSMVKAETEITGTATIGGHEVFVSVMKATRYTYIPMVDSTDWVDTTYMKNLNDTLWSYEALDDTMPTIMLVLPLEVGKTWSQVDGTDTIISTVIAKEDIAVPAQTYKNAEILSMFVEIF
ncbi:MAG: hypothetical protein KGZ86_02415 [Candidatus Latescibacteria bacterium]|nr:hypothetical protein [Candidatus Latescibacterota bacterium]